MSGSETALTAVSKPRIISKANQGSRRAVYVKNLIKGQGRILIRKSGTEQKIRIMGESTNKILLEKCINMIKKVIK